MALKDFPEPYSKLSNMNPTCGHLFLFLNKRANRTKILYWDKDGWVIWYKRLERGRFVLPAENDTGHISATELAMLLSGVDMRRVVRTKRFTL